MKKGIDFWKKSSIIQKRVKKSVFIGLQKNAESTVILPDKLNLLKNKNKSKKRKVKGDTNYVHIHAQKRRRRAQVVSY